MACFVPSTAQPFIVATVSDGAGTAQFGGQGASLVCRSISVLARNHLVAEGTLPTDSIVEDWLDRTRGWIGAIAERRALVPRDFAATLVCLISDGSETIVAHVGDGCAVVKDRSSERWVAPTWPDHGEYASTTFFVTDEGAPKLRISHHRAELGAFAVFSDGIERLALDLAKREPFEPLFEALVAPVAASPAIEKDLLLSEQLTSYLGSEAVAARTDDDTSLILAVRR